MYADFRHTKTRINQSVYSKLNKKKKKLLTKIYFLFYSRKFIFNLKKKKKYWKYPCSFRNFDQPFSQHNLYHFFFFFHPIFNILSNTIITYQTHFFPFVVHHRRNNFLKKNGDKKVEASFDELVLIEFRWNRVGKSSEYARKDLFTRVLRDRNMERDRVQESVGDDIRGSKMPDESF